MVPRSGHCAVVLQDTEMYVFGGYSNSVFFNEFWKYDQQANVWNKLDSPEKVPPKKGHTCNVLMNNEIYVIGGHDNMVHSSLVYKYSKQEDLWSVVSSHDANKRAMHSTSYHAGNFYIRGGIYDSTTLQDFWKFSIDQNKWHMIQNDLPDLSGHHSFVIGDTLSVYAGETGGTFSEDILTFSFSNSAVFPETCLSSVPNAGWKEVSCLEEFSFGICELHICFGVLASDKSVCFGHGDCGSFDNCACENEYFGESCNQWSCHAVSKDAVDVCSGHGSCVASDVCECSEHFHGDYCDVNVCFGIFGNDTSVCSGRGACVDIDSCECPFTHFGDQCENELHNCNGYFSDEVEVCNSKGSCTANGCECNEGFSGDNCQNDPADAHVCGNLISFDPMVCSGRGDCNEDGCTCHSSDYTAISDCAEYSCFGYSNIQKDQVCQGKGFCGGVDDCQCFSNITHGFSTGSQCESCISGYYGPRCNVKAENFKFSVSGDRLVGYFAMYPRNKESGIDCSLILQTLNGLGNSPICQWTGESDLDFTFEIVLGSSATVLPGSSITFLDAPNGNPIPSIVIGNNPNMLAPTASFTLPQRLGSCDGIDLDGSLSRAQDRRSLHYEWTVSTSPSVPSLVSHLANRKTRLVTLSHDLLPSGQTYVFTLKVTSSLSGMFHLISRTMEKSSAPLPRVVLPSDPVQIYPRDILSVLGRFVRDPCDNEAEMIFQWSQVSGPMAITIPNPSRQRLVVNSFSFLSAGSYVFKLDLSSSTNPTDISSGELTVNVLIRDLEARISGGNSRVAMEKPFTLSAARSIDPEGLQGTPSYLWTCRDHLSQPCPAGLTLNQQTLEIPANFFQVPASYRFTLSYTKGSRSSSTQSVVDVVPFQPPQVSILPLKRIYGRGEDIVLSAQLTTPHRDVTYQWRVEVGGVAVDLETRVFTRTDRRVLGLRKNSFAGGSRIRVTVNAISELAGRGFAFAETRINAPPNPGPVGIYPLSGRSMKDQFRINAMSWTTSSDTPLRYTFGYLNQQGQTEYVGFASQSSQSIPFHVPISGNLTLFVEAIDEFGASTLVTFKKLILPAESSLGEDVKDFIDNLQQGVDADDIEKLYSQTKAIANFIQQKPKTDEVCPNQCSGHGDCIDSKCVCHEGYRRSDCSVNEEVINQLKTARENMLRDLETTTTIETSSYTRQDIEMRAETLNSLTADYEELTISSDASASFLLENIVDLLNNVPGGRAVEPISHSVSNLFQSTSLKGNNETMTKVRDTCLEFVQIGIIENLVTGAGPTELKTEAVDIFCEKVSAEDFSGSTYENDDNIKINFPLTVLNEEQISLANDENGVELSVVAFEHNIYPGKVVEDELKSGILSIDLTIGEHKVNVANLNETLEFQIFGEFNEILDDYEPLCQFYNETTEEFEDTGCSVASVNSTFIVCRCNHLTSFGGFLKYVVPDVNLLTAEDFANISKLNGDNFTTAIVMFTLAIMYFILMVFLFAGTLFFEKIQNYYYEHQYQSIDGKNVDGYSRSIVEQWKKSHIWFSLLFLPVTDSSFTRMRRLTVVYMIIIGIFAANALTFGKK